MCKTNRCTRCNKIINGKPVMLELSNTDGNYYAPTLFPKNHVSQGWFIFGKDCAITQLKEQIK